MNLLKYDKMEIIIEVTKMNCDYVLKYLEKMEVPIVSK